MPGELLCMSIPASPHDLDPQLPTRLCSSLQQMPLPISLLFSMKSQHLTHCWGAASVFFRIFGPSSPFWVLTWASGSKTTRALLPLSMSGRGPGMCVFFILRMILSAACFWKTTVLGQRFAKNTSLSFQALTLGHSCCPWLMLYSVKRIGLPTQTVQI